MIWLMDAEQYAFEQGINKPYPTICGEASFCQIGSMSKSALASRRDELLAKSRSEMDKYRDVEKEWEEKVVSAFLDGKFGMEDVLEYDSFYVIHGLFDIEDILSPFRIRKLENRSEYLKGKESELRIIYEKSII